MSRPLRVNIEDGIYHVISRGTEQGLIFREDKDRLHFLDRLAETQRRFRLFVYAYVLMDNHFHLIVCTPEANLSRAVQWLKTSYSMWFNAKYRRVGPLFQGRFKSIPVDPDESWLVELSYYVHLNPVRVQRLGLDKPGKAAEDLGLKVPSADIVAERLAVLRTFPWSSYPCYAGYRKKIPEWLTVDPVLTLVADRAEYRKEMEHRIGHGMGPDLTEKLKHGLAFGRSEFVDRIRELCVMDRESCGKRQFRSKISWEDAVAAVENIRGISWREFSGVRKDWGRAGVCYLCRKHTGMTLREIGQVAGGMDYVAVCMMLKRFETRLSSDVAVRRHILAAEELLNVKT